MVFNPIPKLTDFGGSIPSTHKEALTNKLYTAEKNIGLLRILVVVLHAVGYFTIPLIESISWLEYSIIIVSNIYAFYVYFGEPYKKYKLLLTSYFTSVTDGTLIALNIIATGGFESPFYLVWFLALTSIAYRYSFSVTLKVSFLYSIVYLLILLNDVPLETHYGEILLRIGFIIIHGYLVGFISKDFLELIISKSLVEIAGEELKKRELVLNEAQQIAHVGSWEWDLASNQLSWSDEMYRIYGYKPGEVQISLRTYLSHSYPDDFNLVWNSIKYSIDNKIEFDSYFKIIDRQGSLKYIHAIGKPIYGTNGEVSKLIGTCYDVTKQKKTEDQLRKSQLQLEERVKERTQELKQANKMLRNEILVRQEIEENQKELIKKLNDSYEDLKRTNEDIDNFVYSASHDLKTPVLNIEALVNLLHETDEENLDPFKIDVKQKLFVSLNKMKQTIENISHIAKAQKHLLEDVEEIDFHKLLDEVISENEEVIKGCNALIFKEFYNDQPLLCSKLCVKSVLYNFITNSIKYRHPERNPEILISTCQSGDSILFSVKDNGLGIDLDRYKNKLFGIFKRFHDHVEGTGIGLYMVKRMVEKNKGRIEVESLPGTGTKFTVLFPLNNCKEKTIDIVQI